MIPLNSTPASPSQPHWVLIVDDEDAMCRMLVEALAAEPVEAVAVHDAAKALQAVEQRRSEPLLVITDILMPGMDGLTLARKLGAKLKRTKIVLMSGHLSEVSWWPADMRECTFVAKPFRMAELAQFLREARLQYDAAR
jgi:two-component system cell cycle sensor histidine kinase/response regulator CckA